MKFLEEVNQEYNKLTPMQKEEYHRGYKIGNSDLIKDPNVSFVLNKIFKWEEKQMEKQEEKKKEKEVVIAEEVPVTKMEVVKREMTVQEAQIICDSAVKSRRFESVIQNREQALMQVMAGQEIGFGPVTSLSKINIIKGKISVPPELQGAMIKRSGQYDYRIKKHDNTQCILIFYKDGVEIGESSFTMEDARRAGLVKEGSGWQKYPRNMLIARAVGNGARWHCPHLIQGTYTHEEMGVEVDQYGNSIKQIAPHSTIKVAGKPIPSGKQEEQPKTRKDELAEIKEKYGLDKIKEVKEKLKIKEKILKLDDKTWLKLKNAIEGKKEPEKKKKDRTEIIKELKKKYNADKMRDVKEKLKIKGKVKDLKPEQFEKFIKELSKNG